MQNKTFILLISLAMIGCASNVKTVTDIKREKTNVPAPATEQPVQAANLSKEVVTAEIDRNMKNLTACYDDELKAKPTLSGTITTSFVVEPNGKVSNVKVAESTLKDQSVEMCVVEIYGKMQFPKADQKTEVTFPLTFNNVVKETKSTK
jgi:TonB family protein